MLILKVFRKTDIPWTIRYDCKTYCEAILHKAKMQNGNYYNGKPERKDKLLLEIHFTQTCRKRFTFCFLNRRTKKLNHMANNADEQHGSKG